MRIANLCAWTMASLLTLSGPLAMAEDVAGKPVPRGMGFQRAVTEVARDTEWLDDFLHLIAILISAFVMILMLIVIVRYNRRANSKPSSFTHNPVLEVTWTAVPALILIVIAVPSLRLLFLQLDVPEPDLTIKATGNQWFWSYEYPGKDIEFDSFMIGQGSAGVTEDVKAQLEENGYTEEDYLFATDTRVVVPVDAVVHVLVTASDVVHNWMVPSFGTKIDAVPGRTNETWFRAEETGVFYGQCSELCGKDHAYMPIVVEVVPQEEFDKWVQTQQAKNGTSGTKLAATQ